MKPPIRSLSLIVALLTLASASPPAHAGGLRCSVGEVVIDNLKIGHTYSLKALANLPLTISNTGENPVRVTVDGMVPGESELRQGAEPIPQASWAWATPDTIALQPGASGQAELMLAIPNDPSLLGRKFEAIFWSHTLPEPGELLAYGLKSRVIFSVDSVRADDEEIPAGDLSLSLAPAELKIGQLSPGRTYPLESLAGRLKVRNMSQHKMTVELGALGLTQAHISSADGCSDLLSVADVVLSPSTITLAPGEERAVTGTVVARKVRGAKAKKLMCVIAATVTDLPVRTKIYSRLYAEAK